MCAYSLTVSLTVQSLKGWLQNFFRSFSFRSVEAFGNCEANEGCWCAEASSISETIQRRWISENPLWHGTLHKSLAGTNRSFAHSWRCFCENLLEAMWMSLSLNRVCQDWATEAQLLSSDVSSLHQTCEIDSRSSSDTIILHKILVSQQLQEIQLASVFRCWFCTVVPLGSLSV